MTPTPSPFWCIACQQAHLQTQTNNLTCPACTTTFPIRNGIPLLLPSPTQQTKLAQAGINLPDLQAIYDKAYFHDGLMGTDLDKTYDKTTKQALLAFAEPLTNKAILDVGTGMGKLWDYVPAGTKAYALDPSPVGIKAAQTRHPHLTASVSIAEHLPYPDNHFDIVLAADTLEHTLSPTQALAEIRRVLKPNGLLCASLPIPNSLRKWGWNQFIRQRNLRLILRLIYIFLKRAWLFGRPDFQPIDRDYQLAEWVNKIQTAGFTVDQQHTWPPPPQIPIVYLIRAK